MVTPNPNERKPNERKNDNYARYGLSNRIGLEKQLGKYYQY